MKINRKGQARILSTEELDVLIHYLPKKIHQVLALTCRNTGCRINEACQLTWEDVAPGFITFPYNITKKRLESRTIPIQSKFFKTITEWRHELESIKGEKLTDKSYIFPGRFVGSHYQPRSFNKALKIASLKADLPGCSSHTFRRSALISANNQGINMRTIMSLSGHKSLDVLARYLAVSEDQKRECSNAFA